MSTPRCCNGGRVGCEDLGFDSHKPRIRATPHFIARLRVVCLVVGRSPSAVLLANSVSSELQELLGDSSLTRRYL